MGRNLKKSDEEVQAIYDEIERISIEYDIPTAALRAIVREYGNLEIFKMQYVNYIMKKLSKEEQNQMEKYLHKIKGKYVKFFDLNSPDLIFRDVGYCDINNIPNGAILLNGQNLIEKTDKILEEIPQKWTDVLRIYYGLKLEKLNFNEIAQSQEVSRQNICEKFKRAQIEYDKNNNTGEGLEIIQDESKKEKFISTFFTLNDMFYNHEKDVKNTKKEEFKRILNEMMVQVSGFNPILDSPTGEDNSGEGLECLFEKINILRNNINTINNNSYFNSDLNPIKKQEKILKKLDDLEKKLYKYRLQEEFLSNDYSELVEIINELKDIEKSTQVIESLDLSLRTYNTLKRNSINTITNLEEKSVSDLRSMKGLGKEMIQEILDRLHEQGLMLKDEEKSSISDLSIELQEIQTRYEAIKIKIVECERLYKKLKCKKEQLKQDKIKGVKIINEFDDWLLNNSKFINKPNYRENALKLRNELQHKKYSKKVEELKCDSELIYVQKRMADFKKQKEDTSKTITEIEI